MIQLTATCPTLAGTLTFDSFGAERSGRALGEPLELRLLPGTVLGVVAGALRFDLVLRPTWMLVPISLNPS